MQKLRVESFTTRLTGLPPVRLKAWNTRWESVEMHSMPGYCRPAHFNGHCLASPTVKRGRMMISPPVVLIMWERGFSAEICSGRCAVGGRMKVGEDGAGENPPYHVPVFVLTHHPRAPLVMEGGTTFYFVTDGIQSALAQAREAANGKDVRIGGGAATIRQYLKHRLIDELHIAISPMLLGAGERLFDDIDLPSLGYSCIQHAATHIVLTKS